ncbi:MAG: diacylglycerol kinase family protein [bacterium]|jgi:diacylglycerol kinase (ATP)|nr:diacylglycerol kinase family protein [Bacillota bacterium]HHW55074.1 diacylglycerol kinase family protein [Bacillota bacterium]
MGIRGVFRSFSYALEGLRYALLTQRNLRIHTVMAAAALVAAYAGKFSRGEVVLLLVTITLVVGAELLNTAIEVTVDLISPEYNHLARVAKNVAAAAVLVTACNAVLVGILLFGPPLLKIVQALSP